jgi:hypothetical protein
MRFLAAVSTALVVLGLATSARALTVYVPDDYASISAALASAADIILVRNGTYSGNLTISRGVELRAANSAISGGPIAFPKISGTVTINQPDNVLGGPIIVSGFWITGTVTHTVGQTRNAIIRECRLDGGIASNGLLVGSLSVRGCIIHGNITVNPMYIELTCCSVYGGGITSNYEGDGAVRHNYIYGPAAVGVNLTTDDGGGEVFENVVTGTTDGIVITDGGGNDVTYNEVHDVTNDAFRAVKVAGGMSIPNVTFQHNIIWNAGGDAFDVTGTTNVSLNTVMTCGGYGIRASSTGGATTSATFNGNTINTPGLGGIQLTGSSAWATQCNNNRINSPGGPGIYLGSATAVNYNVVGRSGSSGIVISGAPGAATYRNNTVFLSANHGFSIAGSATASILNNISYGNNGYGITWSGTGTPTRGCNDWFGNIMGNVHGMTAGATDLSVNPLFCDLAHNDVWLSASSPLVGTTCGQIGAYGISCSSPTDAGPGAGGTLGFSAGRRPVNGPVEFSWRPLEQAGLLEVFDTNGARVWTRALAAGDTGARWQAQGSGGAPASPGVYFARLTCGARVERQRVVMLR